MRKTMLYGIIMILLVSIQALSAQTVINTDITTSTVWTTSGSPYQITQSIYVRNGATLTINAGVTVQMASNVYVYVSSGTEIGSIVANGTSGQPVIFTSTGSGTYYGTIYFFGNSSTSSFTHCQFQQGGYAGGLIYIAYGTTPSFINCTFQNSIYSGVYISGACNPTFTGCQFINNASAGLDTDSNLAGPTITGSTFANNGSFPVGIGAEYLLNVWNPSARTPNTFTPRSDGRYNAIIIRGGNVIHTANWPVPPSGFCYFLTSDLYVNSTINTNPILSFAPGTVIKFNSSTGLFLSTESAFSQGTLMAAGTVFTSYRDDSAGGGDTNGDGLTNGAAGDWRGIYFASYSGANSTMSDCIVRFGGNYYGAGVYLNTVAPDFYNCTFTQNYGQGVYVYGASAPIFNNCVFTNNTNYGLYCYDANTTAPLVTNSTFANNGTMPVRIGANHLLNVWDGASRTGNTFTPNINGRLNAIEIFGGNVSTTAIWPLPPTGFCYSITGDLYVRSTSGNQPVLTLPSGTVMKFNPSVTMYVADDSPTSQGKLVATGVTFTSYRDDSVGGGDTNNDGLSSGAAGDWRGIYFGTYSAASSNLTNCTIRYGGSYYGPNVYLNNVAPTFSGCAFTHGQYYGVSVNGAISPVFTNCTFTNNGYNGMYCYQAAAPVVSNSIFANNGSYPVRINANYLLNVWGGSGRTGNTFTPRADGRMNAIEIIGGDVATSSIWPSPPAGFCYFVTGDIYVRNMSGGHPILTLQSGTVLKFNPSVTLYVADNSASSAGQLYASGVTFTSYRDDSVGGGDTNSDGLSSGAAGDWRGIYFGYYSDSASMLTDCTVRYGGSYYGSNVYLYNVSPSFANCAFSNSGSNGVSISDNCASTFTGCSFTNNNAYGLYCATATSAPTVTNSVFANNGNYPVVINGNYITNVWNGPGSNTFTPRPDGHYNAIYVTSTLINHQVTWPQPPEDFCYMISSDVSIYAPGTRSTASLTIASGSVLKFNPACGIYVSSYGGSYSGQLSATDVVFTSYRDDSQVDDTNADGLSSGNPGDWRGIFFDQGTDPLSHLTGCYVCYAGNYWGANIYCRDASPIVTNTTICSSSSYGVYASGSSSPDFIGCTLANNTQNGFYADGTSTPSFNNGNIFSNGSYGAYNSNSNVLDFTYNWWGDSTGPYHPTANSGGQGDPVSNNINFAPWQLTPTVPESVSPTGLMATAVSGSQVNLTWLDQSSSEDGYEIQRKTPGGSFGVIATLSANANSYSDIGLSPLMTYIYRVRGFNSTTGASGYSNEVQATTLSPYSWSANLTVSGNDLDFPLIFGTSPAGTNGYDNGLDHNVPPPGLDYYSYLNITPNPYYLDVDIRSSAASSLIWTVKIVNATGISSTLSWQPGSLPALGNFLLNGTINMRAQATAQFTGNQTITIEYMASATATVALQTGWNLVSVNVYPDLAAAQQVFPGHTVYTYNTSSRQYYVPTYIEPGRGYWVLNLGNARNISVLGDAITNFSINLNAGWFLIGSTTEPVPFADLIDFPDNSIVPGSLFGFNSATNQYAAATQIDPNEGYWLAALQNCSVTVSNPSAASGIRNQELGMRDEEWRQADENVLESFNLNWRLNLSATQSSGDIQQIVIGQKSAATAEFDPDLDRVLPPPAPGAAFELFSQHNDPILGRYQWDIRGQNDRVWTVRLRSTEAFELTWNFDRRQLPHVRLSVAGETIDMRATTSLALPAAPNGLMLTITVLEGADQPGDGFALRNYPNPFNPETSIFFTLPTEDDVTLAVYNINGQLVNTLLDEQHLVAGAHQANWDGRNDSGEAVSSGLYFYRLQAGEKVQTQRCMLLK